MTIPPASAPSPDDEPLDSEHEREDHDLLDLIELVRELLENGDRTVFGCLYPAGRDPCPEPLHKRRRIPERVVSGDLVLLPVRHLRSRGTEVWVEVQRRGWEGLVAKDETVFYRGGRRTEPRRQR